MLAVIIALTCILSAVLYLNFPRTKQPPDQSGWIYNLFFLGFSSQRLWNKIVKLNNECIKHGGITRLRADTTYYLITDPDAVMAVMNNSSCLEKGTFYRFWKHWLGNGLVTASVPIWKSHRKQLDPMFHHRVIDSYHATFNEQAERLLAVFSEEAGRKPFDPYPHLIEHNVDTICLLFFGFSEDRETIREYCRAMEEVMDKSRYRFDRFWLHTDLAYVMTAQKRREEILGKTINGMSSKLIERRREQIKNETQNVETDVTPDEPTKTNKRFIDHLLELEGAGVYSGRQVLDEVNSFFLAGADSTATTATVALVFLGSFPEVQEKVYAEIIEVLGHTRHVDKEDLSKLVYLEAVIKETIRLYPFTPVLSRYIHKDVKVKGYTLSAGSTVFVLGYGTHRLPLWGADAARFRPERWLAPPAHPTHPAAFCGFSFGRRSCIGKPFAMVSLKIVLAHLVRSFTVTADHTKLRFELNFVLKAISGHHISIQKRTEESSEENRCENRK